MHLSVLNAEKSSVTLEKENDTDQPITQCKQNCLIEFLISTTLRQFREVDMKTIICKEVDFITNFQREFNFTKENIMYIFF